MRGFKKWTVSIMIFFALCAAVLPLKAQAANKTQAEALQWVQSKVGQSIDADGANGCQCVDLILAYYDFLGVSRSSGNGADYATNALPAGWSRHQGATPEPGDILIYSGNSANPYGHVAIFESTRVHYHQNFNGHSYVERVTYAYNGLGNPYWGVIRPNFQTGHNPFGAFDTATGGEGKVYISGWVIDEDAPQQALDIHVYIGGPAGSGAPGYAVKADGYRSDVGAAYPWAGCNHGFAGDIILDKPGTQEIYVYIINVGGGDNVLLEPKTVTILPKPAKKEQTITVSDVSVVYDGNPHSISGATTTGNGSISYSQNNSLTDVGTVQVTVTASETEEYLQAETTALLQVLPKDIGQCDLSIPSEKFNWTGNAIEPEITIKHGAMLLQAGKDYSVSYTNQTGPGTGVITVNGVGNYTGTTEKTFEIIKSDGQEQEPSVPETPDTDIPESPYIYKLNSDNISVTITKCTSANSVIKIPSSLQGYTVTGIGAGAFANMNSLTSVKFPSTLRSIGDHAFMGCAKLASIVLPSSLETLGNYVFKNCQSLNIVEIDMKGINITEGLFQNCSSLSIVMLPESVQYIRANAFAGCTALEYIGIPKSLVGISKNAFLNSGISHITYNGTSSAWKQINIDPTGNASFLKCSVLGKVGSKYSIFAANIGLPASRPVQVKKPGKITFLSCGKKKKSVKLRWRTVACSGYQLQKKAGSKWKTVKTIKKYVITNCTVNKLKKNKKYRFRIRAYNIKDGKHLYGVWTYKTVKTSKK